ncbi:hypothetical protein E2C01_087812 [Portunus trituberculatus]|uniref:Uncharacterized protein n=1 Tax=Portunus trituberculatus TaxID=210409 RepID=A0A5B7JHI0_PORTR|nr:hypothetical protein [Portunus trituberculatus]
MRLFLPLSKRGGLELGSAEKRPDTAGSHDVAGDEKKAARFSFTASVHAAFHQGRGRLVKRPGVLQIV